MEIFGKNTYNVYLKRCVIPFSPVTPISYKNVSTNFDAQFIVLFPIRQNSREVFQQKYLNDGAHVV